MVLNSPSLNGTAFFSFSMGVKAMKKFLLPAVMMTLVFPAPAFACIGSAVFFCEVDIVYQGTSATGSTGRPVFGDDTPEGLEEDVSRGAKSVACSILCENMENVEACLADCKDSAEYKEIRCTRRCYQTAVE